MRSHERNMLRLKYQCWYWQNISCPNSSSAWDECFIPIFRIKIKYEENNFDIRNFAKSCVLNRAWLCKNFIWISKSIAEQSSKNLKKCPKMGEMPVHFILQYLLFSSRTYQIQRKHGVRCQLRSKKYENESIDLWEYLTLAIALHGWELFKTAQKSQIILKIW